LIKLIRLSTPEADQKILVRYSFYGLSKSELSVSLSKSLSSAKQCGSTLKSL